MKKFLLMATLCCLPFFSQAEIVYNLDGYLYKVGVSCRMNWTGKLTLSNSGEIISFHGSITFHGQGCWLQGTINFDFSPSVPGGSPTLNCEGENCEQLMDDIETKEALIQDINNKIQQTLNN